VTEESKANHRNEARKFKNLAQKNNEGKGKGPELTEEGKEETCVLGDAPEKLRSATETGQTTHS